MPLPDGETLLAKTATRALALPGVTELVTVTNREYYFHTKDAYAGLRGLRPEHLEPCRAEGSSPLRHRRASVRRLWRIRRSSGGYYPERSTPTGPTARPIYRKTDPQPETHF